jgi:hypothetical protein
MTLILKFIVLTIQHRGEMEIDIESRMEDSARSKTDPFVDSKRAKFGVLNSKLTAY